MYPVDEVSMKSNILTLFFYKYLHYKHNILSKETNHPKKSPNSGRNRTGKRHLLIIE